MAINLSQGLNTEFRIRSWGDMASPRHVMLFIVVIFSFTARCFAGPLGPLPNVTSSDLELKEGTCALGDLVYMYGDEFPGPSPCTRCTCTAEGMLCAKQRCEPRPGCKALHRPDHCCPTYQCECEQEGRVYSNGEKLVDPADPCRVCYCQGGEVVCRRIACFVRDDCRPRLVPGRCCPEYDNCPLRGVTAIPGLAPSISSISTIEDVGSSVVPSLPKANIKQEITIKEITPVSEIPVITDVKIKEILPSPNIEVVDYSSSKSPLIPREATSEKSVSNEVDAYSKTASSVSTEGKSPSSSFSSLSPEHSMYSKDLYQDLKSTEESFPSKISLSTQDSINSDIYPSNIPNIATMGSPSVVPNVAPVASTTKAPIIDEEDSSLFDHNPAFPPLPDDLSVIGTHEDEITPDQNVDGDHGDHVSNGQEIVTVASLAPSTQRVSTKDALITTSKDIAEATIGTTEREHESSVDSSTAKNDFNSITERPSVKESPMLNLRSAIPTEILNVPSSVSEDITGELDETTDITTGFEESASTATSTTTENIKFEEKYIENLQFSSSLGTTGTADIDTTTPKLIYKTIAPSSSQSPQEQTTSSIAKSNIATEVTSQTELSSLPIETSDQNPHETSDNIPKSQVVSTVDPSAEPEVIKTRVVELNENKPFDNGETTEFILTSFDSSETATDSVELIKVSTNTERNAALIDPTDKKKNNVLTDLINLVGDVASISDHNEGGDSTRHVTNPTSISDSEELIPVNIGYKSKNNNWNVNSITEIPMKAKGQQGNKQKIVEIEDDESESITDSPPPNDKVEPTTRRPIIDNVSDDMPENRTEKKDIEIITQSYVPTINKRPTKVVMKKSNEKPVSEETPIQETPVGVSSEVTTDSVALTRETVATPTSDAITVDETKEERSDAGSSTVAQ